MGGGFKNVDYFGDAIHIVLSSYYIQHCSKLRQLMLCLVARHVISFIEIRGSAAVYDRSKLYHRDPRSIVNSLAASHEPTTTRAYARIWQKYRFSLETYLYASNTVIFSFVVTDFERIQKSIWRTILLVRHFQLPY